MSAQNVSGNTSKEETSGTGQAFGTPAYRTYVILTLLLAYTLNFIDRILIQVLSEPIINEFTLKDWQFGLLSGFGFALLYTIAGIPIARFAEHANRVKIIAVSIVVWSVMTALCGIAGSFIALLVFRVGVGIGEAGLTPPANSIIADYFPPRSRARGCYLRQRFSSGIWRTHRRGFFVERGFFAAWYSGHIGWRSRVVHN
jgi:MFS family permease